MNFSDISDVLLYMVPALIIAMIAYYFFSQNFKMETARLHYLLNKDNNKHSLPMRLQAYERMTLFLERIKPSKLLIRVTPSSPKKNDYEELLIANIEQEFEHNLAQQIYISSECWTIITTAKNATIQLIRKANLPESTDSANKLREVVLKEMMEKQSPSDAALAFIKQEVNELW